MRLTMSERKAVTKKLALEHRRGDKARKGRVAGSGLRAERVAS
jgi:hypothetical protein